MTVSQLAVRAVRDEQSIYSENDLRELSKSLTRRIAELDDSQSGDANVESLRKISARLWSTLWSSRLPPAHGAAVLDALCAFLGRCAAAKRGAIRAVAYDKSNWQAGIRLLLEQADSFKAKPSRRLLVTLVTLLQRHNVPQDADELATWTIEQSIAAVYDFDSNASVRSAVQILEYMLNQHVVDVTTVVKITMQTSLNVQRLQRNKKSSTLAPLQHFLLQLLVWLEYPDCVPAISRFLPLLISASRLEEEDRDGSHIEDNSEALVWIRPIMLHYKAYPMHLETLENHVLPPLLQMSVEDSNAFLDILPFDAIRIGRAGSCSEADLQLCLLTVRYQIATKSQDKSSMDPESLCSKLISHKDSSIRIMAFSLLTQNATMNTPLKDETLAQMDSALGSLCLETSSKARNEMIAETKKYCKRLFNVSRAKSQHDIDHETAGSHLKHLTAFEETSLLKLHPAAPYHTHIYSLQVLRYLITNDMYHLGDRETIIDDRLMRPLLDLLFDPYDDIRHLSSSIIEYLIRSELKERPLAPAKASPSKPDDVLEPPFVRIPLAKDSVIRHVWGAMASAQDLSRRSGRADHADGLGRLLYLVFFARDFSNSPYNLTTMMSTLVRELQDDLDIVTNDLEKGYRTTPLHGKLIASRYVISALHAHTTNSNDAALLSEAIGADMVDLCLEVWQLVRPVLCADAPEDRTEEEDDDAGGVIGAGELLSYCWRALKESSLVLDSIISRFDRLPQCWQTESDRALHRRIGQLTFEQLAELRHRGAFSTVSQTFAAWCGSCAKAPFPEVLSLPEYFYKEALACILDSATALTRRSAGLPTIITGILSAYSSNELFNTVVLDLQAIADGPIVSSVLTEEQHLPQVHALNCLRSIFTDARLGASSEPHMADSLSIAAACLDCEIWAIRNCGLMLLKALLSRINGGTDTASRKASSIHRRFAKHTYSRFPILPVLAYDLLQDTISHSFSTSTQQAQKVFPALEIVERFGLPVEQGHKIKSAIIYHSGGSLWAIREKAAKVLSMIAQRHEFWDEIRQILSTRCASQNILHGKLLYLRFLMRRFAYPQAHSPIIDYDIEHEEEATTISILLADSFSLATKNLCPFTAGLYLEVITEYINAMRSAQSPFALDLAKKAIKELLSDRSICGYDNIMYKKAAKQCTQQCSIYLQKCVYRSKETIPDLQPAWPPATPDEHDQMLLMAGASVLSSGGELAMSIRYSQELTAWLRWLRFACSETADVTTRLASVRSVGKFMHKLAEADMATTPGPRYMHLYFVIYDALNDDDEDVRMEAAPVAIHLVAWGSGGMAALGHMIPWSVPESRTKLFDTMNRLFKDRPQLLFEALPRLTSNMDLSIAQRIPICDPGSAQDEEHAMLRTYIDTMSTLDDHLDSQDDYCTPICLLGGSPQHMHQASCRARQQRDNVLFEEEKPNLYIDQITEASAWATVLGLWRYRMIPHNLKTSFASFQREHQACIYLSIKRYRNFYTKWSGRDGVLGLTSNPDIYLHLYRHLVAAQMADIVTSDSSVDETHAAILQDFRMVAASNNIHPHLLAQVAKSSP